MNLHVIYNPNSGKRRGEKLSPIILDALKRAGHSVTPYRTLHRLHAMDIAKHLELQPEDAVLSVGGDGTAYEVLNGIMQNPAPKHPVFGIIPVGTGNSFVKDLGMKKWEDGLKAVLAGKTQAVDIVRFITEGETNYFMNALGFGLVADVCIFADKVKKVMGSSSYTVGALKEIMQFKAHKTKLTVDGEVHEFNGVFTNFSNSCIIGGNMKISPFSVIDDGIIEAVILEDMPKGEIIKAFPTIYDGQHLSNPNVKVFRGKHFLVETDPPKFCNPEGEIFGVTPLELDVLQKEIDYFTLN